MSTEVTATTSPGAALATVHEKEFSQKGRMFRDCLTEQQREVIKANAPQEAALMVADPGRILAFGQKRMEEVSGLSDRMLASQEGFSIPEVSEILSTMLADIKNYSARHSRKHGDGIFSKVLSLVRSRRESLEMMIADRKSILEKIDAARTQLNEMEDRLRQNVGEGTELYRVTLEALRNTEKTLAALEEIVDSMRARATQMREAVIKAEDEGHVTFEGRTYSVIEIRALFDSQVYALNEAEKAWHSWRERYLLFALNLSNIRSTVNASTSMQAAVVQVREGGLNTAKQQLAVLAISKTVRDATDLANKVSDGVNEMVRFASEYTADTITLAAEADQRTVLEAETITAITANLRRQLENVSRVETQGIQVRENNRRLIEQAEQDLAQAEKAYYEQRLDNAQTLIEGAPSSPALTARSSGDTVLGI